MKSEPFTQKFGHARELVISCSKITNMQTTFADTILNIAITGNLVHLDLGTITPVQNQDGKQELRATPTQQVVMPMEGFVRAFGM